MRLCLAFAYIVPAARAPGQQRPQHGRRVQLAPKRSNCFHRKCQQDSGYHSILKQYMAIGNAVHSCFSSKCVMRHALTWSKARQPCRMQTMSPALPAAIRSRLLSVKSKTCSSACAFLCRFLGTAVIRATNSPPPRSGVKSPSQFFRWTGTETTTYLALAVAAMQAAAGFHTPGKHHNHLVWMVAMCPQMKGKVRLRVPSFSGVASLRSCCRTSSASLKTKAGTQKACLTEWCTE